MVSKTTVGSSILSSPAIWMLLQFLELNILKVLDFKQKIGIFNLISFIKGTLLKINYNIY